MYLVAASKSETWTQLVSLHASSNFNVEYFEKIDRSKHEI